MSWQPAPSFHHAFALLRSAVLPRLCYLSSSPEILLPAERFDSSVRSTFALSSSPSFSSSVALSSPISSCSSSLLSFPLTHREGIAGQSPAKARVAAPMDVFRLRVPSLGSLTRRKRRRDCSPLNDAACGAPVVPGLRAFAVPFGWMVASPQFPVFPPRCRYEPRPRREARCREHE